MSVEKINLHPKKEALYCRDCGGLLWERVEALAYHGIGTLRTPQDKNQSTLVRTSLTLECEICGSVWDWSENTFVKEGAPARALIGTAVYNREDLLDYYYRYEWRFNI